MPARSSTLVIGRLVLNIWPGPCVKTPSSLTPLYSPTCVQILPMDARVGDRIDLGGGAAARQLGQQRQHVAGRRVAGGDVGDVDEAVLDRVEGAGRRGGMLRQHLELDAAVGGLLHLLTPDGQHVLGQRDAIGDTQLDMVIVVWAVAAATSPRATRQRARAAPSNAAVVERSIWILPNHLVASRIGPSGCRNRQALFAPWEGPSAFGLSSMPWCRDARTGSQIRGLQRWS